MSDTWSDIQALKSKQSSLREKLLRRKKEREGLVAGITASVKPPPPPPSSSTGASAGGLGGSTSSGTEAVKSTSGVSTSVKTTTTDTLVTQPKAQPVTKPAEVKVDSQLISEVEAVLHHYLSDVTLNFPVDSTQLISHVGKTVNKDIPQTVVENLLQKFSAQQLISIQTEQSGNIVITSADQSRLSAVNELSEGQDTHKIAKKRKRESEVTSTEETTKSAKQQKNAESKKETDSIESLLSMQSAKERENKKLLEEIQQLLSKPTAKEQSLVEKFKSQGGAQVQEFCQFGTKEECMRVNGTTECCEKLHFRKIINKHTDESLGDCSFLNTCFHMDTCKYVHYEIDYPDQIPQTISRPDTQVKKSNTHDGSTVLFPPQWVQCDLRNFDMSVLGKFSVVMADPPWDIHMELPYGTMSDDEMRRLPVSSLVDDGYIFLWVTGRAMELGRECLKLWGYERIDELIWVKTNQLQRIIRTGRTGHWLNHGKEHCLVGVKGNPKNVNRGLDCDVIVAEVRATSHKPDEIYGIIERLTPGTRKIEIFGRPHNVQPNWITLGNQLDGVRLLEPDVVKAFRARYPNGNAMGPAAEPKH